MTNRQWLIWQLIDMSDEQFAELINVPCVYKPVDSSGRYTCESFLEWLKQEHVDSNSTLNQLNELKLKS